MDGGFAELTYLPDGDRSKFIFTGLYNKIDADGAVYDYQTATFSVSHMAARNLRILAEITHDFELEKQRFGLGVASAF